MRPQVLLEELGRLRVKLLELLDNVRANVAVMLLDVLGHLHAILGRNRVLALAQQLLHKVGDITAGDGNVLDGRADDVAFGHGNHVRHAVARVDNGAGERVVGDLVGGPACSEREHCLYSDIHARHVERLEHDFRGVFAVLWRIKRRFRLGM